MILVYLYKYQQQNQENQSKNNFMSPKCLIKMSKSPKSLPNLRQKSCRHRQKVPFLPEFLKVAGLRQKKTAKNTP